MGTVKYKEAEYTDAELARAGFKAFISITDKWGLKRKQQSILLGGVSESTLHKWLSEKNPKLSYDQLERISYILGIHKNLRILLRGESVYNWIRRTIDNKLFNGSSALEVMLKGSIVDLHNVRRYLDGQRGW